MSLRRFLGAVGLTVGVFASTSALATPPIWETDFGDALIVLNGQDDAEDVAVLSWDFPFDGTDYRNIFVGTNGDLQLGSRGTDNDIDYDHWQYMEEFSADGAPTIAGLNTDLDLSTTGTIHFHDFGTRAVFTWNEVGTDENETALISFQITLFPNGKILMGWNGVLDDVGEDLLTDLNEGIVVGVTAGDIAQPVDPGPTDLSITSLGDTTVFERWCYNLANSCGFGGLNNGLPGPINTEFDLDQQNVEFVPIANGFHVPEPSTFWSELVCLASLSALAARRRVASRRASAG